MVRATSRPTAASLMKQFELALHTAAAAFKLEKVGGPEPPVGVAATTERDKVTPFKTRKDNINVNKFATNDQTKKIKKRRTTPLKHTVGTRYFKFLNTFNFGM